MSRRSAHRIVANVIGQPLVIRDVGPWDVFLTVTNDAEAVVQDLVESGLLPVGRRLFSLDSAGEPGELLIHADRFSGFAPVSEEAMREAMKPQRCFYHEPTCKAPRQAPRWADDLCTCAGRQHINHEFDPNDCGGVWDGNQVISDADPGL